MNKPERNKSIACGSVALAAMMTLAGCNGSDRNDRSELPDICVAPCAIDIELPDELGRPPQAPSVVVVEGGAAVNFRLVQGDPSTDEERTVLSFEQAALVDREGRQVFTLELTGGDNTYLAAENVCPPPDGCRYVVINAGRPDRPSVISSPRFVIR